METEYVDGALAFVLRGRIDSVNTAETEIAIRNELSFYHDLDIAFDAKNLEYISSAGLRIFLKLKKEFKRPVRIFNVSDEIFDILSVTGFTEILEVERTMRRITVKGCKKVSSALNGEILGLSEDEIIKIYGKNVPLSEIKQERSYAQTALIAGIPTLIPYDVVSCEYGYGIVFEKAGAHSLADAILHDSANINRYAIMFGQLMREIHSIEIPEGKLPGIKDRYKQWLKQLEDQDDIYSKPLLRWLEQYRIHRPMLTEI